MDASRFPLTLVTLPYRAADRARLQVLAAEVFPGGRPDKQRTNAQRALEHIAGRAAVALAFRAIGWKGTVVANRAFGYLEAVGVAGPAPYVNLSHTDEMAVAVVGPAPVGIDIEHVERDASRVIQRVSTAAELEAAGRARVEVDGRRVPSAVALWSCKEAVSKAVGLGIKFGMQAFEIALDQGPPWPVKLHLSGPLAVAEPALSGRCFGDYFIAVCTERVVLSRGVTHVPAG